MPSPGAQPKQGYDALDLGRTNDGRWLIGTLYTDGSYVIWDADTEEEVAYIEPGRQDPADLGGGRAAVINPDGSLTAFDIANPPPELRGAPSTPEQPAAPGGSRVGMPGDDTGSRVGAGRYPTTIPGQMVPGRPTDIPFGSTVAPSTWNPAVPSQGRSEGWGSIGAGTAGTQYGYGSIWGEKEPLKIREEYLPHLFNPAPGVAPGYIPGSGTYNQYRLDQPGLFGTVKGSSSPDVVNLRYGLGGTGDPTTGGEIQTPDRWITGNASGSTTALQGDAMWRQRYGGGGGWDQSWAAAAPSYRPGPGVSAPGAGMNAAGYGASGWEYQQPGAEPLRRGPGGGGYDPYPTGGGGGMGGGFFTAGPGYSPAELGYDWGQAPQTQGLDYLVTLFMRSDTPTGISTAAWSAPQQYWDGLIDAIRRGIVVVNDPQAWQMLAQKNPAYTPQNIGGAALTGPQPGGGSSTEDAIANQNAADAADRAAYWAYQQALLRQGDERIALDEARLAWQKAYEEANLTGTFNGQQTLAALEAEHARRLAEAGVTGTYNGAPTMAAINQQNQTALGLLGLQSQLSGPRNWARYQSTFGSTPQGLKDVIAAFQGRYQLPGTTGAQAQAQGGKQSVAGLAGDILSGTYGQDGQATEQAAKLSNPYQADLQNWAKMMPSQREMILGQYENEGWYGPDVERLIKGAAPRYAGASGSSYNFFQS